MIYNQLHSLLIVGALLLLRNAARPCSLESTFNCDRQALPHRVNIVLPLLYCPVISRLIIRLLFRLPAFSFVFWPPSIA
ncbi:hypothetical protein DFJ58DRAFT_771290 [Suillus subalutaceus]|uniref:uncharacterized protein n=1 Tax=Suillus subalutaceus TaxID=48586 RepID=UPI001B862F07|nr:uncharacterized protein DFJ58DRAFT_771290 [Suillus subalutaceus]KAG1865481.1 hypothetical protein DFJ58DRAFT_771290 [Suillus subalutaceus]